MQTRPLNDAELDTIVNQIVSDIPVKISQTKGTYFQAMDLRRLLQDNLAVGAEKIYKITPEYNAVFEKCRQQILPGCHALAAEVAAKNPTWNIPPKAGEVTAKVSGKTEALALTTIESFLPPYKVIIEMGAQIEQRIAQMNEAEFKERFGAIRDPNRKTQDNPLGEISQAEAAREIAGGFVFGMAQQIGRIYLDDQKLKDHFDPMFLKKLGQLLSIMTTDAKTQILANPNIAAKEVLEIVRTTEMSNPKNQLINFGIRHTTQMAEDNKREAALQEELARLKAQGVEQRPREQLQTVQVTPNVQRKTVRPSHSDPTPKSASTPDSTPEMRRPAKSKSTGQTMGGIAKKLGVTAKSAKEDVKARADAESKARADAEAQAKWDAMRAKTADRRETKNREEQGLIGSIPDSLRDDASAPKTPGPGKKG